MDTPLLADLAPVTVRPRYDRTGETAALLTPQEFARRFRGADVAAVKATICAETGATVVGVWHIYPSADGTRCSAPLNGDWIDARSSAPRTGPAFVRVVTTVPALTGVAVLFHGVGVA